MVKLARKAAQNAYVPLCQFPVGACLRTSEGKLFHGCNWENAATPLSQCAEASAISAMLTAGYSEITEIVLFAEKMDNCTPCGACRQRLVEFSTEKTCFYSCNRQGELLEKIPLLEFLLPKAFSLNFSDKNR